MLESNKYISFQADEQAAFMKSAFDKKKFDVEQLAKRFEVGSRTVRDWRRGKYKLPFRVLAEISRLTKVPIPDNVVMIDRAAHLRSVGAKGGAAVLAKYGHIGGDTQKRKDAWKRWWEKHGRHQESKILYKRKKIKYPRKSVRLAEFVGILMGDGGITARQVIITLHSENDKEFAEYYAGLCEILFGIRPSITKIKSCNAVNVVISRTDLVEWCHGLGLPIGHKIRQGLDIPDWIKKNPHYSRTCLRGLVDTDGSVFIHRYRVGRKEYRYKKLDFCSLSPALLRSAYTIFRANGMKPYVRPGKILRLENQEDVERYFRVIGSSNPKHLRRYKE
jgi:hypothetical protein